MQSRFVLLRKTSATEWAGVYRGCDIVAELIPGNFEPSIETSDFKLSVESQRISAELENLSYLDPEGEDVFVWGPSLIGKTMVGIGRPAGCPKDALLFIAVQGDAVIEDLDGECAYLQEASIADFISKHETEYLASFCEALKKYESNVRR